MNRRKLLSLIFGAPIAAVTPAAAGFLYPDLPPGQAYYRGHTIVGVNEEQKRAGQAALGQQAMEYINNAGPKLHLLHSEGVVRG